MRQHGAGRRVESAMPVDARSLDAQIPIAALRFVCDSIARDVESAVFVDTDDISGSLGHVSALAFQASMSDHSMAPKASFSLCARASLPAPTHDILPSKCDRKS